MLINVKQSIIVQFWVWYYTEAVKSLIKIWFDFIRFVKEYYSIPLLLKTLFSPWRRDITKKPRGFDLKKLFEALAFNAISRGFGFIARFFTIMLGLINLFGVLILGFLALILWIFLPFILLGLILTGFILLF